MSSDPQNTSSFFRPGPGESSGGSQGDSDSIIEDFNSFFEKLSSLDDLQWSSEPDPDAGTGGAPSEQDVTAGQARAVGGNVVAPAKRPARKPAEQGQKEDSGTIAKRAASKYAQVKQTRKRPRMEVVTSASVATPTAAAAQASGIGEGSAIAAVPHDESFDTAKAARILKLALVSLILFGLGLGAGWAALSLPSRFDNLIPAVKNGGQLERNDAITSGGTIAGIGEWIWGRKSGGDKASLSHPKTREGKSDSVAEQGPQGETSAARGEETIGGKADLGVMKIELPTASGGITSEDGERKTAIPNAAVAGRTANSERNTVAQVPPSGTGAGTSSNSGGFALQVGACSSYRCVESFRKLLLGQVSSGSIKVIAQPSPNGEQVIQRIRIEPLERVEAERLREALKAENPQFEGAYLVRAR